MTCRFPIIDIIFLGNAMIKHMQLPKRGGIQEGEGWSPPDDSEEGE